MSTENLKNQEAIDKLKQLVDGIDIGMMSTFSKKHPFPYTIPMSRQEIDDDGAIWYLCSAESETYKNLENNKNVMISFSDVSGYRFLVVNGIAELTSNQDRIDKYWNQFIEVYFEKGKDDPSVRVLKVIPDEAHYWDNKTNKLMTVLKVATSAITGSKMDIGREGSLDI